MPLVQRSRIVDSRGRHLHLLHSDAWENPYTGHGTSRDKRTGTRTKAVNPSLDRQTFEDLYHGDDLGSRIVDELVEDMCRKWIRINVSMAEKSDAAQNVEAANGMLQALSRLRAKTAIKEALTWARVFGGGLIFIGADDGGGGMDSMSQPLRENAIRHIRFLEVYDRWDIEIESEYTDPLDPKFGQPELYRVQNLGMVRGQPEVQSFLLHESRTIRFDGVRVNKRRRSQNAGWHDSAFVRIEEVLADFGLSFSSAAHLLADFAPMVFTTPGLDMALAQDAGGLVAQRLEKMDLYRSTVRMIPLDEGETLERKATPIAGMDGLLATMILRLCAAARMPVTKLFGQSPSGLNTTAEGDLSFWYDRVESKQTDDMSDQLRRLINLLWLCKTGPTGGVEPLSWDFEFEKLWQMSQLEESQARKTQAETDQIYMDAQVLMPEEIARSRFGGDRYTFETTLDEELRAAQEEEPGPEARLEPAPMETEPNPKPFI